MNNIILKTIKDHIEYERQIEHKEKKDNGVFFTNEIKIIDNVLDIIKINNDILNKKILEPAVGNGIFLLKIIEKVYNSNPHKEKIKYFIENGLYFIDINPIMIKRTKENISDLYEYLFNEKYNGNFNAFNYDFTNKIRTDLTLFGNNKNEELEKLLGKMDYVVGNPPYVTLYGRRDRKKNELQRIRYLKEYSQFPKDVKNGKINYIMLFIEQGLDFLEKKGKLAFIIDISFFETAYKYTRRYLLENTKIKSIETDIANFDGVASGQLILKLEKNNDNKKNIVRMNNFVTNEMQKIEQKSWYREKDEYKFRLNFSDNTKEIIKKLQEKSPKILKEIHPKKSLRTCTMLLNMEDKFVEPSIKQERYCKHYKYYQGSKGLYDKYCKLFSNKYFYYDKALQNKINCELKEELIKKEVKNKKRIGLGDFLVYDNPKIYIRQSAKEIVTTYDESPSAANNSLYIFSLRNNNKKTIKYLKFLCGYLNSEIITFYAQKMEIIRYRKGKQPQIKISDLDTIPVPEDTNLGEAISTLVNRIYENEKNKKEFENKINKLIYDFYKLTLDEISFIKKSISDF